MQVSAGLDLVKKLFRRSELCLSGLSCKVIYEISITAVGSCKFLDTERYDGYAFGEIYPRLKGMSNRNIWESAAKIASNFLRL